MAKRRRSTTTIVRTAPAFGGFRAPAPIIKVSAPRAPAVHKKKHRRRSSSGNGTGGELWSKENAGIALGGFLLGVLDKQGTKIPFTLPIVGRAGTIAIGLHVAGKKFHSAELIRASKAALAIATYELGIKGSISGVAGGAVQTV